MKTYIATLTPGDESVITVREDGQPDRPLPLRLDLANHSPTGFMWGYGGSGPSQTSLAILADFYAARTEPPLEDPDRYWPTKAKTEGERLALRNYQHFKVDVISRFNMAEGFTLSGDRIDQWYAAHEEARKAALDFDARR